MRSSRGSSPLSRGTHTRNGDYALQPRIIPAFAGNTFACSPTCRIRRDHPRFRGEHQKKEGRSPQIRGSSPLSRGTLGKKLRFSSPPRIIPAFAGNTTWGRYFYYNVVDHPRFRGEHLKSEENMEDLPGSSPLSRGTHRNRTDRMAALRIIPAFAGNTLPILFLISWIKDHPRFRGEHDMDVIEWAKKYGSSPLSRGTRQRRGFEQIQTRIIPAFAGNTKTNELFIF